MTKKILIGLLLVSSFSAFLLEATSPKISPVSVKSLQDSSKAKGKAMENKINKSEEQWRKTLTPEQYRILREKGTERAYSGKYWNHFEKGIYKCAGCGSELFSSETKFESHCGWPSYFKPLAGDRVIYQEDRSYGMIRTEVLCAKCGGHLGHVFDDGPEPTGLRYCINSAALIFESSNK